MSFEFAAPYSNPATISLLPSPDPGNTQAVVATVSMQKAIDNTVYTYHKTNGERRLRFSWSRLSRDKVMEVIEFLKSYSHFEWRLTTHRGEIWRVKLITDPSTITTHRKADDCGVGRPESGSLDLEFVGVYISG